MSIVYVNNTHDSNIVKDIIDFGNDMDLTVNTVSNETANCFDKINAIDLYLYSGQVGDRQRQQQLNSILFEKCKEIVRVDLIDNELIDINIVKKYFADKLGYDTVYCDVEQNQERVFFPAMFYYVQQFDFSPAHKRATTTNFKKLDDDRYRMNRYNLIYTKNKLWLHLFSGLSLCGLVGKFEEDNIKI